MARIIRLDPPQERNHALSTPAYEYRSGAARRGDVAVVGQCLPGRLVPLGAF